MAKPDFPLERRLELMAQASAAYQRRIDDLRRKEQRIRLDIASMRSEVHAEILTLAREGRDLVLSSHDITRMSPLDKVDRESLPAKCRDLMEKIEDAYRDLHGVMAKRDATEECRWYKLAQYLTPEELIEHIAGPAASAPPSAVSPALREFDHQIDYRRPFEELLEGKPWVAAKNGGQYYDIYVRTSSDEDRVYIGGPPPDSGEKPPREG